ncbi:hypothetical protein PGT21_023376 [Puccinia graminis f. sp. tritici]|uniref:[histone H3]-trimethyl-L-lysine(4) demethylase n=1 Tax=Puccinia graminis f. sp. tritici TaxID=56615 RepID=A0A5B0QTS9_PUCGR|nr:hypothetical protein PGT21_023376 [Puccinia graminis f. sp. tritici]
MEPKFALGSIRTEVPREFPKSKQANRLFGLEHCPVFYPTIDEFKEPMKYFESIGSRLKPFGIGKIVPPVGWKPPFVLDTDQFKFKTRLQRLNSMEASARANVNFLEQLYLFHKQRGSAGLVNSTSQLQVPVIDHRPVDLWRLRKEINELGGYDNITLQRKWSFLAKTMGYNVKTSPAVSFKLKSAYAKIIAPFDEYFNRIKQSPPKPTTHLAHRDRSPADSLSPLSSSLADHDEANRVSGSKELKKHDDGLITDESVKLPVNAQGPSTRKASMKKPRSSTRPIRRPSTSHPSTSHDLDTSMDHGGDICEICGSDEDDPNILLCDSCDKGYHLQCLTPPLLTVPEGNWYCDACIVSTGNEFGFEEGREHTLSSFQRRADGFKKMWLETHPISQKQSRRQSLAKEEEPPGGGLVGEDSNSAWSTKPFKDQLILEDFLEREFWRLVESQTEMVEVEYGADINTAAYGSGFPNLEKHPFDPYSRDGWNLNNLPIAPGSLLRFIKSDVAGMTQPWIYVGMLFSTFAWHKEDHYTYSINYHHWGDTKTWYGVPGEEDTKLEEAMKTAAPELFEQQPDLMFQLVTLMSPARLGRAGVQTYVCDQRPNEFVITCPRSYHSGFNHGLNLNEAVNFCLPDWLPEGKLCVQHYKALQKMPVFSHDELLVTIFLNEKGPKVSRWLLPHFRDMVEREIADRQTALTQIANLSPDIVIEPAELPEDQVQCHHCKAFAFLSQLTCPDSPNVSCLNHAHIFGDSQKILRCKYTDEELQTMLMRVNSRSVKAGRVVDTSSIEQRTSGRKRKPSTALLEATRAALPLAQKIKLAHASADNREDQNDNSFQSQLESSMANESSIDCDENEKTEHGSTTSDLPTKPVSRPGRKSLDAREPAKDNKPVLSGMSSRAAPTPRVSTPAAQPDVNKPSIPPSENMQLAVDQRDSVMQHLNSFGLPRPPTSVSTPHSITADPPSDSNHTGELKEDTNMNRHYGRPPEIVDPKEAEVEGKLNSPKISHRERVGTPSSSSPSHIHRLPVVAQIDVGGSASIVQLSPSREPILGSRKRKSSTPLSHSELRKTEDIKASNVDTRDAGASASYPILPPSQTSNTGRQGTNVIRLKSSARAVSQPADAGRKSEQLEKTSTTTYTPKLGSESFTPIVLQSLPHLPIPEHDTTSGERKSADHVLTKSSLQPISITPNPRGPSASSLLNLLNPVATDNPSPFDHTPPPPPSNQHLL